MVARDKVRLVWILFCWMNWKFALVNLCLLFSFLFFMLIVCHIFAHFNRNSEYSLVLFQPNAYCIYLLSKQIICFLET